MLEHVVEKAALVGVAIGLLAAGCGPSADDPSQDVDNEASFAIATTVLGNDSNTTYVQYTQELELGEISFDDARTYPGNATIGAVGDMFFVGSGASPKVTRYQVEDGSLAKDGEINFSQYVQRAPLFGNLFVDPSTAYLEREDSGRVQWNPKNMTIQEAETLDAIDVEIDGKSATAGSRRGIVKRGEHIFQPFYWAGPDYYDYAETSKILVYDGETGEVENVIEASCPGLGVGTKDDQGNVYFTNWVGPTAAPVIEGESNAPSPCAVRIDAGETTLNESWTRDLTEMTGGRQVTAMRMLDGSVAIAAVLDEEKVDADSETDPSKITYAQNWELWRLDLDEGTGSKVPGIGYIAGGYYAFRIDGRMVVTLPSADYGSTTGYEIPIEGEAVELFEGNGWIYQMVEIN